MTRSFYINGESMIYVKGCSSSDIGSLQELGLCDSPVQVSVDPNYLDITVDAWGSQPPEMQFKLSSALIQMRLVHFDIDVLNTCIEESMGGATGPGVMTRAGTTLGNGAARFFPGGPFVGNHYIGLNIASPVENNPYRFLFCYLVGHPNSFPFGTERSIIQLTWRAVPYTADPWNSGLGALGSVLWDNTLDT